jgi:hypothetical protein
MALPMKRLMISAVVGVTLAVTVTTMLKSGTHGRPLGSASTVSSTAQHGTSAVNKLLLEEFEDMSLVYSRPSQKR